MVGLGKNSSCEKLSKTGYFSTKALSMLGICKEQIRNYHSPRIPVWLIPGYGYPFVLSSPVQHPAKQGHEELLTAAIERGPSNPVTSLERSGQGCPLLRASNEHCFIVRVLRARRAPGRSSFIPPSCSRLSLQG